MFAQVELESIEQKIAAREMEARALSEEIAEEQENLTAL
jgi:hypothetical protein